MKSRRRGFSLIEVMLALTIMLLALAAIGQLVGIGTEHGNLARLKTRSTRLAESKMAEIECGAIGMTDGSGTFDGDDSQWTWSSTAQPAGPPNLYLVTVTVERPVRGITFTFALGRMMYDPAMMGSASQAEVPPPPPDPSTTGGTSP